MSYPFINDTRCLVMPPQGLTPAVGRPPNSGPSSGLPTSGPSSSLSGTLSAGTLHSAGPHVRALGGTHCHLALRRRVSMTAGLP